MLSTTSHFSVRPLSDKGRDGAGTWTELDQLLPPEPPSDKGAGDFNASWYLLSTYLGSSVLSIISMVFDIDFLSYDRLSVNARAFRVSKVPSRLLS